MRILLIYPTYPEWDTNSGAMRLFEIVKAILDCGDTVFFWALRENDPKYRTALERLGIRCFAGHPESEDGSLADLNVFLRNATPDVSLFVHHFVFSSAISTIRSLFPKCHCILDTVDLHYIRERRRAEMSGSDRDRVEAQHSLTSEWEALSAADSVWVVSSVETNQLVDDGLGHDKQIFVVGNVHVAKDSTLCADDREGVVFLGGYKHTPNVDAVEFFMDEIFPCLHAARPDIQFTIAGSHPPTSFKKFESISGVHLAGFVEDHRSVLESHLVAVAPLRYGAGVKGKIGEYLSMGTPCVTTSIGAEGMGLVHGTDILIADSPSEFASEIIRLHDDKALWNRLSKNGKMYVEHVLSPSAVKPALFNALQYAATTKPLTTRLRRFAKLAFLLNPSHLARLIQSTWQSLRSGGLNEVRLRYRRWLCKP